MVLLLSSPSRSSSLFILLIAAASITAQTVSTITNATSSNPPITEANFNSTNASHNSTLSVNPSNNILSNITSNISNNINILNNNTQINNNNNNNDNNNNNNISNNINNNINGNIITTQLALNSTITKNANNSSIGENTSSPDAELIRAIGAATKLAPSESPRSSKAQVLAMYEKWFLKPRPHEDQPYKATVRESIIRRLQDLGYKTSFLQRSDFEFKRKPASSYNIISILPGRHRHTKDDRILVVGAHWDSYKDAPGADDNGSGSICILEIARLLAESKCTFEHTIMLVWFDYEEQGKLGSEFFVNDYLFPKELDVYQSKFIGAYVMDMILVRDKENNTQTLSPIFRDNSPEFAEELDKEKNRGDFLATWTRRKHDEPLADAFKGSWQNLGYEARTFKAMRPELPQERLPNSEERYHYRDFFRSDHASFWYPTLRSNAVSRAPVQQARPATRPSLNAILLTDLGPWRKSYGKCYHSACDDKHLLTDNNLAFMQQVIDSLVLTLLRVAHGQCAVSKNE